MAAKITREGTVLAGTDGKDLVFVTKSGVCYALNSRVFTHSKANLKEVLSRLVASRVQVMPTCLLADIFRIVICSAATSGSR
jgi:hypothetical protein